MAKSVISILAYDKTSFDLHIWPCENPRAWLHIVHGMSEHCERYQRLALQLNQQGFTVVAHNHRGHGLRSKDTALGHISDDKHLGWSLLVDDIRCVHDYIHQQQQAAPVFLLGHSMGSYVVQQYMITYAHHHQLHDHQLHGVVLSGSNYSPPIKYLSAKPLAYFERFRLGSRGLSQIIDRLSFGSFNNAFKPNTCAFDWLSRDADEVAKYVSDPYCGHLCSNQFWLDLLSGLAAISNILALKDVRKSLPILMISGDQDPVGQFGKGARALQRFYQRAKFSRVTLTLYPNARHELFNETNRQQVTDDLIKWLTETLNSTP